MTDRTEQAARAEAAAAVMESVRRLTAETHAGTRLVVALLDFAQPLGPTVGSMKRCGFAEDLAAVTKGLEAFMVTSPKVRERERLKREQEKRNLIERRKEIQAEEAAARREQERESRQRQEEREREAARLPSVNPFVRDAIEAAAAKTGNVVFLEPRH